MLRTLRSGLRFSHRFVAGTHLADAVRATEQVNQWGASVSIDNLGENVTNTDEAKHSAELYHQMLDEISSRKLNANISLKLTHMGFDVDEDLAFRQVTELVAHAVQINSFVRVDMEGSPYTQRTLDFVRQLHRLPGHAGKVGTVIQTYLYRSEDDVKQLLSEGIRIRLCKGAYKESPEIAFPKKADVDANYVKLAKMLLKSGVYHGLATHDENIIEQMKQFAKAENIPTDRVRVPDAARRPPRPAAEAGPRRLRYARLHSVRNGVVSVLHAAAGRAPCERVLHRARTCSASEREAQAVLPASHTARRTAGGAAVARLPGARPLVLRAAAARGKLTTSHSISRRCRTWQPGKACPPLGLRLRSKCKSRSTSACSPGSCNFHASSPAPHTARRILEVATRRAAPAHPGSLAAQSRTREARTATEPILNYESQQPPLYYWLLGSPLRAMSSLSLLSRIYLVRLLGLLLASLAIPLAYWVARQVLPSEAQALGTTAIIVLLPELMINIARVSNESLALVCYTAMLVVAVAAVREPLKWRNWLLLGLSLGCGLLTKAYMLSAVPGVVCSRSGGSRSAPKCDQSAPDSPCLSGANGRDACSCPCHQRPVVSADSSHDWLLDWSRG